MLKYDLRLRLFAITLSALSGFVDALGFINLGGFFVSFMSGNSTRLGVGLAEDLHHALISAGLLFAFLVGVVIGWLFAHRGKRNRAAIVLLVVAILLALASAFHADDHSIAAVAFTAMAMGAMNCVFMSKGEVTTGVTYMTGTLVKLGQGIARNLVMQDKIAWGGYLYLWLGLVAGAALGGFMYPLIGLTSLWFAAAGALGLSLVAAKIGIGEC